jgi:hypothetical protein
MEAVKICVGKRRPLTPESERHNQEQNRRLRALGPRIGATISVLEEMASRQHATMTRPWLRDFADRLISDHGKPALDRLTKRHKGALIAWFAQNCPEFLPASFQSVTPELALSDPMDNSWGDLGEDEPYDENGADWAEWTGHD